MLEHSDIRPTTKSVPISHRSKLVCAFFRFIKTIDLYNLHNLKEEIIYDVENKKLF